MNEEKFSKKVQSIQGFSVVSLERLPIQGCPDLLLFSHRSPSMSMMVELKTVDSINCKVNYEKAQPTAISDLHKVGTVVGTLVYIISEDLIVWVHPEHTVEIHRGKYKIVNALLNKQADVICGMQDIQWKETLQGYFESLINRRMYLNNLN